MIVGAVGWAIAVSSGSSSIDVVAAEGVGVKVKV